MILQILFTKIEKYQLRASATLGALEWLRKFVWSNNDVAFELLVSSNFRQTFSTPGHFVNMSRCKSAFIQIACLLLTCLQFGSSILFSLFSQFYLKSPRQVHVLQLALNSNVFIVSQMLASQFPSNFFLMIIGRSVLTFSLFFPNMLTFLHFAANGWFSSTSCNIRYCPLHVPTSYPWPHPYINLHCFHALRLCDLLKNLDWSIKFWSSWCREAA